MPESYEALIEIYKDKQKDLNIDIMEDAGGLGEMLGEGGVAGHSPLAVEQLPSQRRKKHIPHKFPKLGEGGRIGMMYGGDPGFAFSYGGSWADWKENHASEMPVMDYINQKLPKARNPFSDSSYEEGGPVKPMTPEEFAQSIFQKPYNQLTSAQQQAINEFTSGKAEGGRIGMAKGDTPSEAYLRDLFYDGGWDAKGDIGLHEFMHGPIGANEWFKHNNKAEGGRIGFADGDEVFDPLEGAFDDILEEIKKQRRKRKAEELKDIKNWDPQNPTYHASGGRIGFKKGGKGGIKDLMSEMYRLFSISPLLGSPELMDLIQKVPFEKGGRAGFEKGGKSWWNNPMTRRTFGKLGVMGALLAGGMRFGPKIAKTKPVKDISVKLKSWIDDSDEMTEYGPQAVGRWAGNFDISSSVPKGIAILKNLFGKSVKTVKDKTGKITASIDDIHIDDSYKYVDDIIKKGKGSIDFKYLDDTGAAQGVGATLESYAKAFGKNSKIYKDFLKKSKKMTEKQKIQHELREVPDGGEYDEISTVLNRILPGKAEGGIIEDDEFREFLEDRKNRDKDNFQRDFFEDFKKWKKWKEGNIIEAKDGGRMWQPKSAPQLTTTIPPESGPMPHGLTYLTGDDIVQNIGYKHGRN